MARNHLTLSFAQLQITTEKHFAFTRTGDSAINLVQVGFNPFTGAEGMASGGLAGGGMTPVVRDLVMQIEKQGIFGSPQTNAQGGFDAYGSPPGYTYDPQAQQYVQQMAKGGIASGNLADFKMYEGPSDSEVEDLTASQLEAAADSDDPYLMGLASLERDRRKGAGTKGYKRKEFAHGGLADLPEYAAGGKLLRGPGETDAAPRQRMVRIALGTFLVFAAVDGLLFITHNRPSFDASLDEVIAAGGYLGMVIGTPLVGLLAPWGAGLVMVALGVIGTVIATGVSVRTAARRTTSFR